MASELSLGTAGNRKTHTLGRLLASYLRNRPSDKILLVSGTNTAVDLALLAVDKVLGRPLGGAAPSLLRFGSRFDPKKYAPRQHLIPLRDKRLLGQYENHLQKAPDPAEPEKYKAWRDTLDALRRQIREETQRHLANASVAAMTSTYAIFEHDAVSQRNFDLVVIDEASQVSKTHAITMAALGRRVLFAGDPGQLSPIAQADSDAVRNWLAASPFEWWFRIGPDARVTLDEQWRMAEPICRAVSRLFYPALRVADPALRNPTWVADRTPVATRLVPPANVNLLQTFAIAEPARQFVGYVCKRTAEIAAAVALDLHHACPDENVSILTPYRAQRRAIQAELQALNLPASLVSTVHRAQGSERRNVIVDLVKPGADFVNGAEGKRLINVAVSRAECRLIILLQIDWQESPILRQLAEMFRSVNLNFTEMEKVLLRKAARITRDPEPRSGQAPAARTPTLAEQFHQELLDCLRNGPHTNEYRRRFARDLSDRAKYCKKLPFAEIQREIDAVMSKLPRVS